MQTSQPKPCPFCGKADELSRNPFTGDVVCDACGASVDEGSWNNRPVEDALREALEAIAKGAPLTEPEWIDSDNSGDIADNASDLTHYRLASIARAAITKATQGA